MVSNTNVRKDGALTSTPFVVVEPDGSRTILSGNHRRDAAIEAGMDKIFWLETTDELSPAERRAIQISHNAIEGQDDPAILAQLYAEIDTPDLKAYAGLDDAQLDLLADVDFDSFKAANLEFQTLGDPATRKRPSPTVPRSSWPCLVTNGSAAPLVGVAAHARCTFRTVSSVASTSIPPHCNHAGWAEGAHSTTRSYWTTER